MQNDVGFYSRTNSLGNILPNIPATPGPKKANEIQENVKERFAGVLWIQKLKNKLPSDYFSEYDHWEIYDENKIYSKRPFQTVYTENLQEYQNYLCIMNNENNLEDYYVIAKRIPSELEVLYPYCPCIRCDSLVVNPLKYLWCPTCTKCLRSGCAKYIERAKKIYRNKELKISEIENFKLLHYTKLRCIEVSIILIIIGIFYF